MHVHSGQRGFTLIEMVVLVVIMAVLSSIAVPTYNHFKARMEFTAAVQGVVQLFAYARDTAIHNDADCSVRYDAQSGAFVVTVEQPPVLNDLPTALADTADASQPLPEPRTMALGDNVQAGNFAVQSVDDPTGTINQTGAAPTIVFRPDGTSDAAQFTLASVDGFVTQLQLVPTTGLLVVSDDEQQAQ